MNTPAHSDLSQRKNLSGVLVLTAIAVLGVGFFAYYMLGPSADETAPDPIPAALNSTTSTAAKTTDQAQSVPTDSFSMSTSEPEKPAVTPVQSNTEVTPTPAQEIDDDAPTPINIARENQAIQTQYLREALPGNEMVPFERTPQEAEALMAEFQEHNELRQKIESGTATAEDQARFYELRASKLQDEIDLIKLCQDVRANALDAGEETEASLCKNATANGEQRLQELQEMLAELEKKYL